MTTAHISTADHEEIVITLRAQFAARATDLLEANNRYLERARDAEQLNRDKDTRIGELEALVALLQKDNPVKVAS